MNHTLELLYGKALYDSAICVHFIVLYHGGHKIHHGFPIRRKMVTIRMDLNGFSLSKPCEKSFKSIHQVTIFLCIWKPWWMLYISNIKYREVQPAMQEFQNIATELYNMEVKLHETKADFTE